MPTKSILSETEGNAREVSDMYDAVVMVIERVVILNGRYEEMRKEVPVTGAEIKRLAQESLAGEIFFICDLSRIKPISLRYIDINFAMAFSSIIIAQGEIYLVKTKGKNRSHMQSVNFDGEEIDRGEIAELIAYNASTGGGTK